MDKKKNPPSLNIFNSKNKRMKIKIKRKILKNPYVAILTLDKIKMKTKSIKKRKELFYHDKRNESIGIFMYL